MLIKTPDYFIAESGCPQWKHNENNRNLSSECSDFINAHKNGKRKCVTLLTTTTTTTRPKLLPLRETLSEYYKRCLSNQQHHHHQISFLCDSSSIVKTTTTTTATNLRTGKHEKNICNERLKKYNFCCYVSSTNKMDIKDNNNNYRNGVLRRKRRSRESLATLTASTSTHFDDDLDVF